MPLQPIRVPDSIKKISLSAEVEKLVETAYERIEAFMLSDESTIENFVNCDFHLVEQSLQWIQQNHLLAGNRFCELGSGFGVVAMLAASQGMESVGIEIEPSLVEQSSNLAEELDIDVEFYAGSFIPRDANCSLEMSSTMQHVDTAEGDIYEEIGLAMDEFDLFFAFPWPGEEEFFEAVFDACASDGALLLTYHGREGMRLVRRTSRS
jgi:Protein-L-isoaspartate(D-aspartate) O-methyltransferase (PCMT)